MTNPFDPNFSDGHPPVVPPVGEHLAAVDRAWAVIESPPPHCDHCEPIGGPLHQYPNSPFRVSREYRHEDGCPLNE